MIERHESKESSKKKETKNSLKFISNELITFCNNCAAAFFSAIPVERKPLKHEAKYS